MFPESCEIIFGQDSLVKYFERISQVDCFVSSGTGPLHIASAMGQKCIGIFPPKKALDIARWGAMGALSRNIVFDKKICFVNQIAPIKTAIACAQSLLR